MKRYFISQPMNGKNDDEIRRERDNIISEIKSNDKDAYIIDSFFAGAPHDATPLWFLGKSFELLSTADVAVFSPGWEKARGCRMEFKAAVEYGIEVKIVGGDF